MRHARSKRQPPTRGRTFVTDTIDTAVTGSGGSSRGPALTTMRLAELQALAASLGVTGTSRMRKSDLVDVIRAKRAEGGADKRSEERRVGEGGDARSAGG